MRKFGVVVRAFGPRSSVVSVPSGVIPVARGACVTETCTDPLGHRKSPSNFQDCSPSRARAVGVAASPGTPIWVDLQDLDNQRPLDPDF